jgi:hypothetical protein
MPDTFDIKFEFLPPELKMKLWVLGLDANTSKVAIAYSDGGFKTSIQYNYGGNIEAGFGYRRLTGTLGYNPTSADHTIDFGLVYQGFRFDSKVDITQRSVGVGLGYGRKLLPFPDELASTFNAANGGLMSMARDIDAAPGNPLAWWHMHSDDVQTIGKAISAGQQIADQKKETDKIGVGLRLNYNPQTGFTIWGGVGVSF